MGNKISTSDITTQTTDPKNAIFLEKEEEKKTAIHLNAIHFKNFVDFFNKTDYFNMEIAWSHECKQSEYRCKFFNTEPIRSDTIPPYEKKTKELLSKFDINTCYEDGSNLFHIYSKLHYNIYLLDILLERGCNINKRDNTGKTPIFTANSTTLPFFIKNDADLTIRDNENHTALYYLSKMYYSDIVEPLIQKNPQIIDYD